MIDNNIEWTNYGSKQTKSAAKRLKFIAFDSAMEAVRTYVLLKIALPHNVFFSRRLHKNVHGRDAVKTLNLNAIWQRLTELDCEEKFEWLPNELEKLRQHEGNAFSDVYSAYETHEFDVEKMVCVTQRT
jgi:hypothetical protein